MAAYGGDVAVFYLICLSGWFLISAPFALVCRKAGRPMWIAFVPWYSFLVELEIAELPSWWLILAFVPIINIWIYFKAGWELGRSFGRGTGFCFGLAGLYIVFIWILAFDSSTYQANAKRRVI